jgi:hypothetical protein
MLIALLLAFLALGASDAQALVVIGGRPVGITFGQTARLTAANTGRTAITITGVTFLDSEGVVLGQFERQTIQPGKMMSFDLNADDIVREGERIQIRVVLSANTSTGLVTSTEVFENDTGKTTVFLGGPDT